MSSSQSSNNIIIIFPICEILDVRTCENYRTGNCLTCAIVNLNLMNTCVLYGHPNFNSRTWIVLFILKNTTDKNLKIQINSPKKIPFAKLCSYLPGLFITRNKILFLSHKFYSYKWTWHKHRRNEEEFTCWYLKLNIQHKAHYVCWKKVDSMFDLTRKKTENHLLNLAVNRRMIAQTKYQEGYWSLMCFACIKSTFSFECFT